MAQPHGTTPAATVRGVVESVNPKGLKVDGRWMLDEIALPLAAMYPREAWEILWGYDQQALVADRASRAILAAVSEAQAASEQAAVVSVQATASPFASVPRAARR